VQNRPQTTPQNLTDLRARGTNIRQSSPRSHNRRFDTRNSDIHASVVKRSRKCPANRDVRGLELLNNAILNNRWDISKHTCCLPIQLPRIHKHDEFIYGVARKIRGQFLEQLKSETNAPQSNPGLVWTQSVGQSQIVCVVLLETMLDGIKPEQRQP